jgi:Tfp pilus assembly protein PilF
MRRGIVVILLAICLVLSAAAWLSAAGPTAEEKIKEATARAAQDYFKLGLLQAGEGQDADAAEAFRKALAIKPQWAEAHSLLGSALGRAGDDRAAEEELRKAVKLQPDYAEGYYALGVFLKERHRDQEAQEAFNKAKQYRR